MEHLPYCSVAEMQLIRQIINGPGTALTHEPLQSFLVF
jgi:hypothetical protein